MLGRRRIASTLKPVSAPTKVEVRRMAKPFSGSDLCQLPQDPGYGQQKKHLRSVRATSSRLLDPPTPPALGNHQICFSNPHQSNKQDGFISFPKLVKSGVDKLGGQGYRRIHRHKYKRPPREDWFIPHTSPQVDWFLYRWSWTAFEHDRQPRLRATQQTKTLCLSQGCGTSVPSYRRF